MKHLEPLPGLETARLLLRPLAIEDAPAIYSIFSDPRVTRYWGHDTLRREEEAEAFIQKAVEGVRTGGLLEWGIVEKQDQQLIGTCAYAGWDAAHRRAEIGFALRADRWGNGYMSEVLERFIPFGFERLGLHRIEADTDPRNRASIALLEKFGFEKEGCLRDRYLIGDEYQDAVFYGLIESNGKE